MNRLNYYIDIDGTICTSRPNGDYEKAEPIPGAIDKINELYRQGHMITYWTSRGKKTGIDWHKVTINQFREWGVKYDFLRFDKPLFDFYVDNDKAVTIKNLGG